MKRRARLRACLASAAVIAALAGATGRAHAQTSEGDLQYVGRANPYEVDPVADTAIISLSLAFGAFSQIVLNTGEIVPQQPQDPARLNWFDRFTVEQSDPWAGPISDWLVYSAIGWAVADPIAAGVRDGGESGVDLGVMYAETLSLTWAAANTAKLVVRRPRPRAYQEQKRLIELYGKDDAPNIAETDYGVSFFSGHTAIAASVSAAATYHSFVRDPDHARPWITLGVGSALTTMVAVQRVRSGAHFPSDVVAGAMAGIGIGLLVPHLHREEKAATVDQAPVQQPLSRPPSRPLGAPQISFGGAF